MLLIFWVVTPLVSAVFTTREAIQVHQTQARLEAALLPIDRQVAELSNNFMISAYKYLWANEPLPPFTTERGALIPFSLEPQMLPRPRDANWTSATTMFSTRLTCKPADIVNTDEGMVYDNGQGCASSVDNYRNSIDDQELTALNIGYWSSQFNDYYLKSSDCNATSNPSNQHVSLGLWNYRWDLRENATVIFCEPSYTRQEVNATVLRSNLTVIEVVPLDEPIPLSPQDFNFTNFEYVSSTDSPARSRRADINDTFVNLNQKARLKDAMGINYTLMTSPMEYALAATRLPLSDYSDPNILSSSFEKANQLLFALAIQSLLIPKRETEPIQLAEESYTTRAVIVVRPLAWAVEAALIIVAGAAIFLGWIYHRRPSGMIGDPASIEAIMKMIRPSMTTRLHQGSLTSVTTGFRVHLEGGIIDINKPDNAGCSPTLSPRHRLPKKGSEITEYSDNAMGSAQRPWEMHWVVGILFIALLCAATAVIVLLQHLVSKRKGLSSPSHSEVVTQIVTSYLPVMFATLLEPFWTLLNRILCVLQPLEALKTGRSPISRSLSLRYSSLPPQLSIWRAVRARDWLLVSVCFIGLSTNILTVALGALFTEATVEIPHQTEFHASYEAVIQPFLKVSGEATSADAVKTDPGVFILASSGIEDPSLAVPWTNQDTFFVPFEIGSDSSKYTNRTYKARTTGFQADVACRPTEYDTEAFIRSGSWPDGQPPLTLQDGGACDFPFGSPKLQGGQNNSIASAEFLTSLTSKDQKNPQKHCDNSFLAGFLRANLSVTMDEFKTDNEDTARSADILAVNSLSSTWVFCQSSLAVADYEVVVDLAGRVKNAVRKGSIAEGNGRFFAAGTNETYFMNRTLDVFEGLGGFTAYWHNDSYVDNWIGYLVKSISKEAKFIDPAHAVPRFDQIAPVVEDAWRRVFVTQLALNRQWLVRAEPARTIPGSILSMQSRLVLSRPALVIALVLLSFNIVVAVAYYWGRPSLVLPKLPITLARIVDMFDGSGLLHEAQSRAGFPPDCQVGYGRFVGIDGQPHIGVERQPFVIPFEKGRRRRWRLHR